MEYLLPLKEKKRKKHFLEKYGKPGEIAKVLIQSITSLPSICNTNPQKVLVGKLVGNVNTLGTINRIMSTLKVLTNSCFIKQKINIKNGFVKVIYIALVVKMC